jgi:CHAD domain-containing protein
MVSKSPFGSVKPSRSFRDTGLALIPSVFDAFLEHRSRVVAHPRLKEELHGMRLNGKILRYTLETFVPAFGEEYAARLEEVKQLLDLFGNVHDCDIHLPRLQAHLREVRLFNLMSRQRGNRLSTAGIVRLIREQRTAREDLFSRIEMTLIAWQNENFKGKLLQSMLQ